MGVKAKFVLLFYISGLTHHLYTYYYSISQIDYSKTTNTKIHDIKKYENRFLTSWNMGLQTLYFLIATIFEIMLLQKHNISSCVIEKFSKIRGFLFSTLVLPTTAVVSFFFWVLYHINSEYVVPKGVYDVIPYWVNHSIHTNIIFLPIIELALQKMWIPSTKTALITLTIYSQVYNSFAGVGRTGTIILTDICLRMAAAEGQIDVLKYLHIIRENRANMVDNFNQYKLVHMVLLEYLLASDTNIPCNKKMAEKIENIIETGEFRKQLDYLRTTAWHNKVMMTKSKVNPENNSKNRFPLIVPDSTRIYISRYPYNDEYSDYINAIPVDGFQIKDQFIVTQNPLPNTLKDFWRMVNEQNCKVIVSLNDFESNDESCSIFWPNVEEALNPMSHFIIEHKTEARFDYFDVIKVQITNQNAEEGNEISFVKIIHYKNWKRNSHLPQNPKSLISLYEEAHSSCRDGSPMIITCYDGTTACGVFVALSFVIEKIKLEQLCDISLATRVVRYNREQFIINYNQFLFLYKAALEYVNSFEEYGNFQGLPITK